MSIGLPLIIVRPAPAGEDSLRRAKQRGLDAYWMPVFAAYAVPWSLDSGEAFDSVLLTSGQAPRLAGAALGRLAHQPVFAVGEATAAAARDAGLAVAMVGQTNGQALIDAMTSAGKRRILWLCGREHSDLVASGAELVARPCYAVDSLDPPSIWHQKIAAPAVMMAHSARAAERLSALVGDRRKDLGLVAISAAVAQAAGAGWKHCLVAEQPTDSAMLALADALCHKDEK